MSASSDVGAPPAGGAGSGAEAVVTLPADLHARPAGAISRLAASFDAEVELECGGRTAMAVSVLLVMGLGARAGAEVTVRATGAQAHEAVAALTAALADIT